jgi:hypothetical protein
LKAIKGGRETEAALKAERGHFIVGCDGTPFLEPRPEVLDLVAVVVDPISAADRRFVKLGRDHRACSNVPDVPAAGVAVETPIPNDPLGHTCKLIEQGTGVRQFLSLARR